VPLPEEKPGCRPGRHKATAPPRGSHPKTREARLRRGTCNRYNPMIPLLVAVTGVMNQATAFRQWRFKTR
jgi:hypothetical protein